VGRPDRPIGLVWTALDPAPNVIRAAVEAGVDLLVSHHPLIFKPLQRIDGTSPAGNSILDAAAHGLCVYVMHTNYDAAPGGMNDRLAKRLGMTGLQPFAGLEASAGSAAGRCGRLAPGRSVRELAETAKLRLCGAGVRVVGDPERRVTRAAVAAGSGGDLLPLFFRSDAEVFITGDLRYHHAREIEASGRAAIDIGHFHSERQMAEDVAAHLRRRLRRTGVRIEACTVEHDPFMLL
jgi:dinuclear metal center YbgI/SA1388 family protein